MTTELDYQWLNKELDRVKTRVFAGPHAAFIGSLMCHLEFIWDDSIKTACTNGIFIKWNPYHFMYIPPRTRITVLVHEIWHVALLHMIRRLFRHPLLWNIACDIMINNMLDKLGYSFEGAFPKELGFDPDTKPCLDHSFGTKSAEEIYEEKFQKTQEELDDFLEQLRNQGYEGDLVEPTDPDTNAPQAHTILNQVVSAATTAGLGGMGAGSIPGEVTTILKRFLNPKLPWNVILTGWFNDMSGETYSMRKPNRRFQDIYLPSIIDDSEGLDHVACFEDVSGSVSDAELIRCNSEMKAIKDQFHPRLFTLVQFDTRIRNEKTWEQDEPFDEVVVTGRGGTRLEPVRNWIIENRPTAVVIFSDLQGVDPMKPLPFEVPIIWIAVNNHSAVVKMGRLIHIRE